MDYLKLYIGDIDKNIINMKKINDNKYIIQYNKKLFYILPDSSFNNYGIKSFSNTQKITLLLDPNNHKLYIELINHLYNKIKQYINTNNPDIEVINPISNNMLDLNINSFKNNSTKFFEVKNNNVTPIDIEYLSNKQFIIAPIFYIYQLTINNNKLYFNFLIYECYIEFHKPLIPILSILNIFNKSNNKEIDNTNNEEYIF
jgi:DNA-dependent RNA polymerase auxiliary subunit epsilon